MKTVKCYLWTGHKYLLGWGVHFIEVATRRDSTVFCYILGNPSPKLFNGFFGQNIGPVILSRELCSQFVSIGHTDALILLYNIIYNKALLSIYLTIVWPFMHFYVLEYVKILPKMQRKPGVVCLVSPGKTHFSTGVQQSAPHIWKCGNRVAPTPSSVNLFSLHLKIHTLHS